MIDTDHTDDARFVIRVTRETVALILAMTLEMSASELMTEVELELSAPST